MAHQPPAVVYPVGPCRVAWLGLVALAGVWATGLALWALEQGGPPWPGAWWWSLGLGVAWLAWGVWQWRHPLRGLLHWAPNDDGPGAWRWQSAAYRHGTPLTDLQTAFDGQSVLLLRARTPAGLTLWLWLSAATEPTDWEALRRAVRADPGPRPAP
ncbi:hypothetical protein [Aquabacterium sp. A08]|uniref:hypothetical protein n=1 Tax=Aquabacterium sp. A08 TaxID=2718532 RepID=UPI001422950C|nr:hypothetical protein [Aquabacterium sp. A08]NIC43204.1 hypothetical protein [Aquabacterium sp. A08]